MYFRCMRRHRLVQEIAACVVPRQNVCIGCSREQAQDKHKLIWSCRLILDDADVVHWVDILPAFVCSAPNESKP